MAEFNIPKGTLRTDTIVGEVDKIIQSTVDQLRKNLEGYDSFASGRLAQSIDMRPTVDKGVLTLTLYMEDYWKFINDGVKGTQNERGGNSPYSFKTTSKSIPQRGISEWITEKGINVSGIASHYKNKKGVLVQRKKKLSTLEANKTLAFAIARTTHKKGIKPRPFVSDLIDEQWIKNITVRLGKAYKEDIESTIIEFSDGNND